MSLPLNDTRTDHRLRLAGIAGITGGALALAYAVRRVLEPPITFTATDSTTTYISPPDPSPVLLIMVAVALLAGPAATAIAVDGLRRVRAGGSGRFARVALVLWPAHWAMLAVAYVLARVGILSYSTILPVYLVTLLVGGLGGGIVVVRARVLHGWRRWTPLTLAAWTTLLLVPQLLELPRPVTALLLVCQAVLIGLLGVALLTTRGIGPAAAPVTGLPTAATV
jgi:hypothetical protein